MPARVCGGIQLGGHPADREALSRVVTNQHPLRDFSHLIEEPDHDRDRRGVTTPA